MSTAALMGGPWVAESRGVSDSTLVVRDGELNEVCVVRAREDRGYTAADRRAVMQARAIAEVPEMVGLLEFVAEYAPSMFPDAAKILARITTGGV